MNADQQGAERAVVSLQPPITTSCPARHLALVQLMSAAGAIGRALFFGDDAFQATCGRPIATPRCRRSQNARHSAAICCAFVPLQQCRQPLSCGPQAAMARKSSLPANNRSKAKKTSASVFAVRKRRLQGGEIRRALMVQRHHLAVENGVWQIPCRLGDGAELGRSSPDPCGCEAWLCHGPPAAAGDSRRT